MMEWQEADPIPKVCESCKEEDCYNCDIAGIRWTLSKEDELRIKHLLMVCAAERLQRKAALPTDPV